MKAPLSGIRGLQKSYPVYGPLGKLFPPKTYMRTVSNVSPDLYGGGAYSLVGESSYGKSTTRRPILGLVKPDRGEILYRGRNLTRLNDGEFRPLRRDLQMVFQDTSSFPNPCSRIGVLLGESLVVQGMGDTKGRRQKVLEISGGAGLSEDYYLRYPHELSGGQVQRLGIARALVIKSKLIICDGPVLALDTSIRSQILNMLTSLQGKVNLGMLLTLHDIGVVCCISSRTGTMYLGTLVEGAGADQLFAYTLHPYTQILSAPIPGFNKKGGSISLQGEPPMYTNELKGCVSHTRCPYTSGKCRKSAPELTEIHPGRRMVCRRVG